MRSIWRTILAVTAALSLGGFLALPAGPGLAALPRVTVDAGTNNHSLTVVPDTRFDIAGGGYQPGEMLRITAAFPLYNGNTHTDARQVKAGPRGGFWAPNMYVPHDAKAGTDTLAVSGEASGRVGHAALYLTYRPAISLSQSTLGPGQAVTVGGHGFVPNSPVNLSLPIGRNGTFGITLRGTTYAGRAGNIHSTLTLPGDVTAGTYTVIARDGTGGFQATTKLTVQAAPAPTATPSPTAAPAPTPLPLPTPGPLPHIRGFGFKWISLWYHTVRQGTWDRVVVQGMPHTQLGVWAHVIFPNGFHYDYYTNTDHNGQWAQTFSVPKGTTTRYSNQVQVQFQLWHGKKTVKTFMRFTLVG